PLHSTMAIPRRAVWGVAASDTVTVQVAFFFLFQLVTVIVALPLEMPVTTPLEFTEATLGLLLL
ncbi:MAG: hypothetical protein Q4D04_04185, partial [Clostridia bacterium]|nr:hypothetical protein [Clostridia bacterium]